MIIFYQFRYIREIQNLRKKINHTKRLIFNINRYFSKIFSEIKTGNYLDKMQYIFQKVSFKRNSREGGHVFNGHIYIRVFLDHRIEFAATIPLKYKIKMIKKNLVLTSDKSSKFMIFQNIF